MSAKLTLVLLATCLVSIGPVSIGPVCAQSANPFKGRTVGDFGARPKASVQIVDDGPVKRDFRSAPDIAEPASKTLALPKSEAGLKVPVAPVSAREAAHKAKLKSSLSPKLIQSLDKNACVGDFEHTNKDKAKSVWGKPMTAAPMTAKPMTLRQVPPSRRPGAVRGWKF